MAKKANKTFEELVPPEYRKWKQVFSNEAATRLLKHQPWDHAIDFTPNAKPTWRAKVYPMSPLELEELDKWIDENLEKKISNHLSHLGPFQCSLSRKRMESYISFKTTVLLTRSPLNILIQFHLQMTLSIASKMLNISLLWIFAGVITIFVLKKAMKKELLSRPTVVYTTLRSCSLVS